MLVYITRLLEVYEVRILTEPTFSLETAVSAQKAMPGETGGWREMFARSAGWELVTTASAGALAERAASNGLIFTHTST